MRTKKFVYPLIALFVIAATVLSACGGGAATEAPATQEPAAPAPTSAPAEPAAPAPTEAPADPMAALYEAAKAEGMLTTIALPHDWCNYGGVIEAFKAKYPGIEVNELNPDAGSGDEIEAIKANMNNTGPQAPDVVDVGFSFGEPNKDLFMPFKVSTWDTIPDGMKSPDGYWYGDYYGVMAFLVNTDVQPDVRRIA
jgi:putative spermidine/putrescine transport system substrate-binding protein